MLKCWVPFSPTCFAKVNQGLPSAHFIHVFRYHFNQKNVALGLFRKKSDVAFTLSSTFLTIGKPQEWLITKLRQCPTAVGIVASGDLSLIPACTPTRSLDMLLAPSYPWPLTSIMSRSRASKSRQMRSARPPLLLVWDERTPEILL